MRCRAWIVIASIVSLFASSQLAYGLDIKTDNYTIYLGDVTGDGSSDFYFSGKPLIVILHGDIDTPLALFPGDFLVFRGTNGEYLIQHYKIPQASFAQFLSSGVLKLGVANVDYFMWKNGSSEQTNILLRAAMTDAPSPVLANFPGSLLPLLSQTISPNSKANISDRDIPFSLKDVNADGTLDFLVGAYVYKADPSGIPSNTPQIASQATPNAMIFSYDTLGRLTFVNDSRNGNRDYDYDRAGNRLNVAAGVASDSASEPIPVLPLPAPTGLVRTHVGDCGWTASWNPVAGATSYVLRESGGKQQILSGTSAGVTCPDGKPEANKPLYVVACRTSTDCGLQGESWN